MLSLKLLQRQLNIEHVQEVYETVSILLKPYVRLIKDMVQFGVKIPHVILSN